MTVQNSRWMPQGGAVRAALYLMTKPDEAAARALHRVALQARARDGLVGRATDWDRLYVTLVPFALEEDWLRQSRRIETAVDGLAHPAFRASLDRIYSFGSGERFPLVATADDGVVGFRSLREALVARLDRSGAPHFAKRAYQPHVTLLRDRETVGQTFIDPVSWTVGSVQLVLSLLETRQHVVLAEWPLSALAEERGAA